MKQEWRSAADTAGNGAYTVKKSRTFNFVTLILSVLLAILLWTYSMNVRKEKTYKLDVQVKNGEPFGYFTSERVGTVTVTLSGRTLDFRNMDPSLLVAYVDLGTAKPEDGAQQITIQFRIPENMKYTHNGSAELTISPKR